MLAALLLLPVSWVDLRMRIATRAVNNARQRVWWESRLDLTRIHLNLAAAALLLAFIGRPSMAQTPTDHLQRAVALMSQGHLASTEKEARLALAQPSTQAVA